ncbi:hypothetical protein J5751_06415 [bacterium]|nr:hypothetical protein [bacterium]
MDEIVEIDEIDEIDEMNDMNHVIVQWALLLRGVRLYVIDDVLKIKYMKYQIDEYDVVQVWLMKIETVM